MTTPTRSAETPSALTATPAARVTPPGVLVAIGREGTGRSRRALRPAEANAADAIVATALIDGEGCTSIEWRRGAVTTPSTWMQAQLTGLAAYCATLQHLTCCDTAHKRNQNVVYRMGSHNHEPLLFYCHDCVAAPQPPAMLNDCFHCGDETEMVLAFEQASLVVLVRLCFGCAAEEGVRISVK